MSGKVMGAVWDAELSRREKYVLLAYADHADHWGNDIYPSLGRVAWKTGYDKSSIKRITKVLVDKGWMIPCGISYRTTNQYKIDIDKLPKLTPYAGGGQNEPPYMGGGSKSNGGGVKSPEGGVTVMTPEPSFKPLLTINEKLKEQELNIWQQFKDNYEREIATSAAYRITFRKYIAPSTFIGEKNNGDGTVELLVRCDTEEQQAWLEGNFMGTAKRYLVGMYNKCADEIELRFIFEE